MLLFFKKENAIIQTCLKLLIIVFIFIQMRKSKNEHILDSFNINYG